MIDRSEAEEHLRIIRALMEKATIYRAISAEAAAVGGVLAIAASFAFGNWMGPSPFVDDMPEISGGRFVLLWVAVLAVAAGANLFFLWRDARRRGDVFGSAGMRLAIRAVLPSYIVAAYFTWLAAGTVWPNLAVFVWMLCHGLALLATSHFAPRSLQWLGWAFIAAGLYCTIDLLQENFVALSVGGITAEQMPRVNRFDAIMSGQKWMALTFGLFHLAYAACTWPRHTAAMADTPQP